MEYKPNEKSAVTNLQNYLRQISYTDHGIPPVPLDGIYDSATRGAVTEFQKKNGLDATGICDRETWNAVYSSYLSSLEENEVPLAVSGFPRNPCGYTVSPSSPDKYLIYLIQFILFELSARHDAFDGVKLTGVYDDVTVCAVREFQLRSGIEPTGNVDIVTWNLLVRENNSLADNYLE